MKYFIGFVIYFTITVIGIMIVLSFHFEFDVLIIPMLVLIPIVFCGIGILGDEDSRNSFTEKIISKIYNLKHIMNLFLNKTVASKYKILLYLFKKTHPSFTIIRSEKSLVQFILGKNEGLQYWCITQDFNALYPLNETVTITMNVKIEGHSIYIKRDFHQTENQEKMYNVIMLELCQKFIQLAQEFEEEEINEQQNNKENETQNNKQIATKEEEITFVKEWSLLSFVKENGGKMCVANCTNKTTGNVFKACIISDGNKENRIYVSFHPRLGELSSKEISDKKDKLQIGLTDSNRYYIYEKVNKYPKLVDDDTEIQNEDSIDLKDDNNVELTNKQKIITLVCLCVFTNSFNGEDLVYKAILGIDINCVNHYPLVEKFLSGGEIPEETKEDIIKTMCSIKDKRIVDMFIGYCCCSSYFIEHKPYIQDFKAILTNWRYTNDEIENLIKHYREDMLDELSKIPSFIIPIKVFQKIKGNINTINLTDNETGCIYEGYVFTIYNYPTYVLPSPFYGFISLDILKNKENKLYVQCGVNGCYFLCDEESNIFRNSHFSEYPYWSDEIDKKYILRDLNIKHNYSKYTITRV